MMILRLNKEIYREPCLRDALCAYKSLAMMEVSEEPSYWVIHFQQCRCEEQLTVAEFENYLIDRMNSRQ